MVETHCCFCGQQCGIKLLVKENQVIGFDSNSNFDFPVGPRLLMEADFA
jgi:assimilatory nitrate reductase catalytic subunit